MIGSELGNEVVFLTAADERYFPLCLDLITSMRKALGSMPRMRVLDVGLNPKQIGMLAPLVERVISPGWDIGEGSNLPGWFRAMTARPHLPNYAGGAKVVTWIDTDAWVQSPAPVRAMVEAARLGSMAIVEEQLGSGFTIRIRTARGLETHQYSAESVKKNVHSSYDACFGRDVADSLAEKPQFNSGAFALRADSPSWRAWQEALAQALAKGFHFLAEQDALNVAIRSGKIGVAVQPVEANYICHNELPWFDPERRVLTVSGAGNRIIGVVHLGSAKPFAAAMPIPHFPDGRPQEIPVAYTPFQIFIAQPQKIARNLAPRVGVPGATASVGSPVANRREPDAKVGRNDTCPCGSGKKFKHCHGRFA